MTNIETDEQDILNPEDTQESDDFFEDDEISEEEEVDYKSKFEESEEKRKQLFARLKRDKKPTEEVPDKEQPKDSALSQKDLFALMKADIHEDDLDQVEKFAKLEGVSVAKAIKSDELKAVLQVRQEKRESANVTNVKGAPRGTNKVSDESILTSAEKGKMPDDPAQLVRARRNSRTKS